jgi:thymidylate synthase
MFEIFEGPTADQVWQAIAATFRDRNGTLQDSRAGLTHEILHAAITVSDPRQRWVVSRLPPMNPAFAIAEVIWIMCGRNDARFLTFWNTQLPKFAGDSTILHGAYGYRLRQHFGFDQLSRAYQALKHNPDSRQVILQIWDGSIDFPDETGKAQSSDIPCNVSSLLKIRNGKLEWTQVIRSNDLFLGLPHNLVQFTCLQEILAGWLNVEVGSYNQISDSLHVYTTDWQNLTAFEQLNALRNTDNLALAKAESETLFRELAIRVDEMISPCITELRLGELTKWHDAPCCFRNLLALLIAECARRNGWRSVCDEAISACTNGALAQLWGRWVARVGYRVSVESS